MKIPSSAMSLKRVLAYLKEVRTKGHPERAGQISGNAPLPPSYHPRLSREKLLSLYRIMVLSRSMDDREIMLQKQGQSWFTLSGAGKEAVQVAAGEALRPTDPICGYYRDRALVLHRGITPAAMFMQAMAAREDPASAGRQMPLHYSDMEKAVIPGLSPTGAHSLAAEGLAEALKKTPLTIGHGRFPADSVVYFSIGDGTTAEGEVYETLRAAVLYSAPLICHFEDDGYGISVSTSEQVPGEDVLSLFRGWPNLRILDVDGTDFRKSYDAFLDAAAHARSGRGPVIVRSRVVRLYSHSSTDDMKKYRPPADIGRDFERDPIEKMAAELLAYGVAAPDDLLAIHRDVDAEVAGAVKAVIPLPKTDTENIFSGMYRFDPLTAARNYRDTVGEGRPEMAATPLVMGDAIRETLKDLFRLLPQAIAWGEDIADLSPEFLEKHPHLDGKGGVFGITRGLQREAGSDRVFNSPICEASIVGRAVGYSLQGYLPIVEIQFRDYLNPAWQQLMDQVATLGWRTGGAVSAPMIIRMASGGYLGGGGAIWHSESAVGPLIHYPGIHVCVPSNARDAVGLLRGAAFCGDPVVFLESKSLYRRKSEFLDHPYPDYDVVHWPGSSRTYGDGKDLAFLAYGNTVPLCFEAMKALEKDHGIRSRMVDTFWMNPIDEDAVRTAAEACGKVLVVEEDRRMAGAGTALMDVIQRDKSLRRRVEVARVAALDCRVPYGPWGEDRVLPNLDDVRKAALDLFD